MQILCSGNRNCMTITIVVHTKFETKQKSDPEVYIDVMQMRNNDFFLF